MFILIIDLLLVSIVGTTLVFQWLMHISFIASLVSTIPTGTLEMSVTAGVLNVDLMIVRSLHILCVIFLFLPSLLKVVAWLNKEYA